MSTRGATVVNLNFYIVVIIMVRNNIFQHLNFSLVKVTGGQTESDEYEPIMHMDRYAQQAHC